MPKAPHGKRLGKVHTRREVLGLLGGAVLAPTMLHAADERVGGLRLTKGVRQLFLDDDAIQKRDGLKRVVNQPTKHPKNPLIQRDRPWEQMRAQVYGTAMFDPEQKLFRLWYQALPRPSEDPPVRVGKTERVPHTTLIAYATSQDGIVWEKPNLGQLSFEDRADTNLVDVGRDNSEGPAVLYDAAEPDPKKRYKMLFWEHTLSAQEWDSYVKAGKKGEHPRYIYPERNDGMWLAYSPDGVQWTNHGLVANYQSDSGQNLLWDPQLKKYVAFGRYNVGRRVARMESDDAIHWTPAKMVLECDANDGPKTQIYGIGVTRYEGLYLGMVWIFHEGSGHGIDVQLVHSRNGIDWQRTADRQLFLANGSKDSWDGGDIRTVTQPVVVGDTIYIYYCASIGSHNVPESEQNKREYALKYRSMSIGVATLRRDGFVSLDTPDQGLLVSKPLELPSAELHLNVDATGGSVDVLLRDLQGKVVAQAEPITGDCLDAKIRWRQSPPALNEPVVLEIQARSAKLYSYWVQ